MTGRWLAAVPDAGVPAAAAASASGKVAGRRGFVAAVGACSGCGAPVRELDTTPDGRLLFDAEPVPRTPAVIGSGLAYVMVRRAGVVVTVNAELVAAGALAGTSTCLLRHLCRTVGSGRTRR